MRTSRATSVALLSLGLGGCNSILDLKDLESVNEAQVWKDPALAEAYVNKVYADNLPGWSTGDASTSDESPGGSGYMYGQLTESSVDYWCTRNTTDCQHPPYDRIRSINILLAEIDKGTLDAILSKRLNGEGYFFRAWAYWELVKLWVVEMKPGATCVRRCRYPGARVHQDGQEIGSVHRWAAATRPLDESQGATGANRPTVEMVNPFPMHAGRPIANNPAYDSMYFWKNRDPRFKATIAYNGAVWELSGKAGRRQWTYVGGESNNPTPTGFYTRKAVDPRADALGAFNGQTQWIEIRFAEVLMNLAEAANAIGHTQEAYDQIIALSARAGIDPGTGLYGLDPGMRGAALQAAIVLERQIEFAYEAKRFWDLRRNMLFEALLNGTRRHGVTITLTVPAAQWNQVRDTVDLESEYQNYFQTQSKVLDTQFPINWQASYYFFAIPASQLQLNSKLAQTVGWAGGTFDPLQ